MHLWLTLVACAQHKQKSVLPHTSSVCMCCWVKLLYLLKMEYTNSDKQLQC